MDPISIIIMALAAGVAATLKPTTVQTIKDMYVGIKGLIQRKYEPVSLKSVAELEADPDSKARQAVVQEDLEKAGAGQDEELLREAKALLDAIQTHAPDVPKVVGLDLEDIKGASLTAEGSYATGVKVKGVDIQGDIRISDVIARSGEVNVEHPSYVGGISVSGKGQTPESPEAKRINAWISERATSPKGLLRVGETSTLNFKVGQPVESSLITGPGATIPLTDIPQGGLDTEWVVNSRTVEFGVASAGITINPSPLGGSASWTARFSLHVPGQGESLTAQLSITPRALERCTKELSYAILQA